MEVSQGREKKRGFISFIAGLSAQRKLCIFIYILVGLLNWEH